MVMATVIVWNTSQKPHKDEDVKIFVCAGLSILLLIGTIITGAEVGVGYANNQGKISELEAFYSANAENYSTAVKKTESLLSEKTSETRIIEGSIEKFSQANSVSQRISEQTNAINEYNEKLAYMKAMDKSIIVGIMYPKVPEHLKPIIIE